MTRPGNRPDSVNTARYGIGEQNIDVFDYAVEPEICYGAFCPVCGALCDATAKTDALYTAIKQSHRVWAKYGLCVRLIPRKDVIRLLKRCQHVPRIVQNY